MIVFGASDPTLVRKLKHPEDFENVITQLFIKETIPMYRRTRKPSQPKVIPFQNFQSRTYNSKASLPKLKQKEIDTIGLQFRQMIQTKVQKPLSPKKDTNFKMKDVYQKEALLRKQGLLVDQNPLADLVSLQGSVASSDYTSFPLKRAKTAAPKIKRPQTAKAPAKPHQKADLFVTTLKFDLKDQVKTVLDLQAPIRKQTVLIPKHKRVKKRPQKVSDDEEIGSPIPQVKTQLIPGVPKINKADWKHFKPWIVDEKLPKWAADLKEAPLQQVLTFNSTKGQEGLDDQVQCWQQKTKNGTDLPGNFAEYFKLHDRVMAYGKRYQSPTETRLQEIYRHFAIMIEKHKEEIKKDFNLGESGSQPFKMNPIKMREDVNERRLRQERKHQLDQEIQREIERVMGPIEELEVPVFNDPKLNATVSKRSKSDAKQLPVRNVEKTPERNPNLSQIREEVQTLEKSARRTIQFNRSKQDESDIIQDKSSVESLKIGDDFQSELSQGDQALPESLEFHSELDQGDQAMPEEQSQSIPDQEDAAPDHDDIIQDNSIGEFENSIQSNEFEDDLATADQLIPASPSPKKQQRGPASKPKLQFTLSETFKITYDDSQHTMAQSRVRLGDDSDSDVDAISVEWSDTEDLF